MILDKNFRNFVITLLIPRFYNKEVGEIADKIREEFQRAMTTLHEKLWLWGQSPDCHYDSLNTYQLPAHSRMTAMEGAAYFDIPNMCRVRMLGHPMPPYDQESIALLPCREVVWSLLGAGAEPVTEWGDVEEVIRQAKIYPNITGGVFDDFFIKERIEHFTPERLREVKKRMCTEAGRNLDMWVVCYEDKLDNVPNIGEYLNAFDVITFWTWKGSLLDRAQKNIDRIRALVPGKRVLAGCYMWNYGESRPMTIEQMKFQTDLYLDYLKQGKIDGIVVCSNCIADLGLDTVAWMRDWIREHKNDVIG